MYQVEIYGRIRRAVLVEGRSQRSVAREFGLARVTVRKMVGYSIPPGYRRKEPAKRPKLGPWIGVIDAILEEDKTKPGKQRHTAQRIFDRLRAEHAFPGGYTIVKDYVRAARLRGREMFVPLHRGCGRCPRLRNLRRRHKNRCSLGASGHPRRATSILLPGPP